MGVIILSYDERNNSELRWA